MLIHVWPVTEGTPSEMFNFWAERWEITTNFKKKFKKEELKKKWQFHLQIKDTKGKRK